MKVLAIMPTIPRREETAKAVVQGLRKQGASVLVHLNGHGSVPPWATGPGLQGRLHPEGTGPAVRLTIVPEADAIFFVDDDMAYPPDYVTRTLAALRRLGAGTAVCYHGSAWPHGAPPKFSARSLVAYSAASDRDRRVAMMGTGTTAFHRADLARIDRNVPALFQRDDDIWISAACARARIKMVRPPSKAGWLNHTPAAHDGLFRRAIVDGFRRRDAAIAAALALGRWSLHV